ncbi:hypothetical protein [Burkholderia sp. Bp9004]|uniref:hypothetical protein n=1 Tax=Burkholderia sp. Bp9004 TaxID=2184559 RepID=UPI000F5F7F93|nr:hypothetical protein [Burkholderia sp. Bp9004]RQZ70142.1 hypothetical protein DIE08_06010 [Burkholderia sp. Bp9004]
MFWIITQDCIDAGQVGAGRYNGGSTLVIRDAKLRQEATDHFVNEHASQFEHEFQLLDDDRRVYLLGRCAGLDDADGDAAFEPLDWATPRYGCTAMRYRKVGAVEWEDL